MQSTHALAFVQALTTHVALFVFSFFFFSQNLNQYPTMPLLNPHPLTQWQLTLMEDDALVSIIWMGLRFDDPGQGPRGQWFPAAAFLSCKEASRVLSKSKS